MARHNRSGKQYPNAYVFHVEADPVKVAGGTVYRPELWLGPWCIWRGDELEAVEDQAAAVARAHLVATMTRLAT